MVSGSVVNDLLIWWLALMSSNASTEGCEIKKLGALF
jgi:hypothetical protein